MLLKICLFSLEVILFKPMANRHPSHYLDIGVLGEELLLNGLQSTGWVLLHRRWRCRWEKST